MPIACESIWRVSISSGAICRSGSGVSKKRLALERRRTCAVEVQSWHDEEASPVDRRG
jgi:hypothetical protein